MEVDQARYNKLDVASVNLKLRAARRITKSGSAPDGEVGDLSYSVPIPVSSLSAVLSSRICPIANTAESLSDVVAQGSYELAALIPPVSVPLPNQGGMVTCYVTGSRSTYDTFLCSAVVRSETTS